ncbi:serine/threonine-protein kinase [Cellulosimicrobium marinum]|uniref:serine/threonine-protein kinase n=1 Tax=Cellulosimicrobium marinum TaxID=1638992 RepID=UPI001E2CE98A|nr:serine/threonine-protein kinase [Cellulosimicrobium marinum]MCB7136831.1 serine/threonine protein kinase [Cellulosimicrobium marinum]
MSTKRAPSPPPEIQGFEYVSLVGSGGFSDVFLYQQQRPRRRVAVKVLLHEWSSPSQRAAFDAEADLMATLSNHPSIVTMYEADVADDGRPYLAMEYCSRPNLGARYRTERLSVAEALRIAVQIAGAVETAHRAGILHRDIKPANILVTEYGHPALTDFGISSTVDDAARAEGMSIPWSPPESFAEPPRSGIATDVWALAATTYTLLAGRSPFEVPGGSNSSANLISRIESSPLPRTGRTDVPASLERVLATAMAKNPGARYPTMLAFARALQQVQNELALAVTPIDLLDDSGHVQEEEPDDDGGTRLRQVVSIDPSGPGGGAAPTTGAPQPDPRWSVPHAGAGAAASYGPGASAGPGYGQGVPAATTGTPGAAPAAWTGHAPSGTSGTAPTSALGHAPVVELTDPSRGGGRPGAWGGVPVEDTVQRTVGPSGPGDDGAGGGEQTPRRGVLWIVLSAVLVVAVAVGGVLALTRDRTPGGDDAEPPDEPTSTSTYTPSDNLGALVPPVNDLVGTYDPDREVATFTWAYDSPDAQEDDGFAWRRLDVLGDGPYKRIFDQDEVELSADPGEQVCIEVVVDRSGRQSASPQTACVQGEAG